VRITRLDLTDFRNYERMTVEPSPGLTIIVGPNAVGKTNIIEAVQLVTAARSFRRSDPSELVRWGAGRARVALRAEDGPRLLEVQLDVDNDGHRSYLVNGQAKRRHSDVAGLLPSVVFTPDDLGMVKGPSERRRASIDDLGEQLSATYGSLRRDYGRAVRQRNTLLKEGVGGEAAAVWDEQVAVLGARFVVHRTGLLERLMEQASLRYAEMSAGETLSYTYEDRCGLGTCGSRDVDDVAAAIREQMERRRPEERRRLVTLAGPHRDDIVIELDGRDARSFASQGQQRTIALAWKLAEVAVVEDVLRRKPVLLLDDVMSELDADRRSALSEVVSNEVQTIVTTTNTGYFSDRMLARCVVVPVVRRQR
jgi:DNA replication and repair protein RecF